jgi:hypothetical protein
MARPNEIPEITGGAPATAADARLEDDARAPDGATGTRGILGPVAVALMIGLIFVSVYLAAFHAPRPHHLPIAMVGTIRTTRSLAAGLNDALLGGFTVNRVRTNRVARDAIEHRQDYGAVLDANNAPTMLYAGANGLAVTSLIKGVVATTAAEVVARPIVPKDILPAARGDTRGLSIFYAAFGLVLGGFLFGTLTYQLAPQLELRQRLLSLAIFGVAGGLLITLIAKAFGAIPGPLLGLAGVIALMAMASGGAAMSFVRLFGGAGVTLGSIVLLVLGNSTSGGSLPPVFLPGWLRPLSGILPVGVGVRALGGLSYFHNDGLVTAVAVLGTWIAACATILYARDSSEARRSTGQHARTTTAAVTEQPEAAVSPSSAQHRESHGIVPGVLQGAKPPSM